MNLSQLANPRILDQPVYEPGKPMEELAREYGLQCDQICKLASNENPWGASTTAQSYARDALKKNAKDASAWRLCSQAHFQLGETSEAEMTILEAIRHQPFDLEMRLDYLRIARETLPSKRYLQELEKVRELFPESVEVLWELARRYHIVENMPVTAAVLYRKIVQIAPSSSALAEQAEMELLKLRNQ